MGAPLLVIFEEEGNQWREIQILPEFWDTLYIYFSIQKILINRIRKKSDNECSFTTNSIVSLIVDVSLQLSHVSLQQQR